MKKTLIAALAAIAMVSCGSSYKTKTVTLSGENDSVNYALGIANGAALRMQLGADTTEEVINEFIEALERGYAGKVEEVEPSSPKGIGQSIGMSLKASEKRGLADNPAWALNEKILLQGLVNAILGDTTVLSVEAAGPFFQQQYMASQTDAAPEEVAKAITTTKCPKEAKTIELKNLNDSLNYAFGLLNGTDIQRLVSAEDLDELVEGINSSLKMKAVNPQFRHMGESIGKQIKEQEPTGLVGVQQLDTDFELIKQGFINGLYHFDMDAAEANAYVQNAISRIQYGETKVAGEKFLEENKLKEGVICTESGLQYEVLKMGNGRKPAATDRVRVHYHGTLTDGTVFDSSVDRGEPITFGLDQVIKGWTEGVQLMPVGSKFRFYIPEYLGYGERPAGQIPPFSTLIFEVELLGIE